MARVPDAQRKLVVHNFVRNTSGPAGTRHAGLEYIPQLEAQHLVRPHR